MKYWDNGDGSYGVLDGQELASDPELWTVTLRDGRHMTVMANDCSSDGDEVVFSVWVAGSPPSRLESLRIYRDLLAEDWTPPRHRE